jgi:hypothetical protein
VKSSLYYIVRVFCGVQDMYSGASGRSSNTRSRLAAVWYSEMRKERLNFVNYISSSAIPSAS